MALMPFRARYTLDDGSRGVLHLLAPSSCAAVITTLDTYGEALRSVSVRRSSPPLKPVTRGPSGSLHMHLQRSF